MEKSKTYKNTKFSADVIKKSFELFTTKLPSESKISYSANSTGNGNINLRFDNDDEFFSEYRKSEVTISSYTKKFNEGEFRLLMTDLGNTYITIQLNNRSSIEAVFGMVM